MYMIALQPRFAAFSHRTRASYSVRALPSLAPSASVVCTGEMMQISEFKCELISLLHC